MRTSAVNCWLETGHRFVDNNDTPGFSGPVLKAHTDERELFSSVTVHLVSEYLVRVRDTGVRFSG